MIVIFEVGRPAARRGWFRSTLSGHRFLRFWFLWFAVAVWGGQDLKAYGDAIQDAEWIERSRR